MEPQSQFFIVLQPGFEDVGEHELCFHLKRLCVIAREYEVIPGGIEINLEQEVGFALNHLLKIPTRILMRLETFSCTNETQLKNAIQSIPWRKYLSAPPKVSFSSTNSRLYHKKKITEISERAIKRALDLPKSKKPPKVFLRIQKNKATFSVDTSGEILHKRGQSFKGLAPLRETLAAAMIWKCLASQSDSVDKNIHLIDPMCGGGTIVNEGASIFSVVSNRTFAYQNFSTPFDKEIEELPCPFETLTGFDSSTEAVEAAQVNKRSLDDPGKVQFEVWNILTDDFKLDNDCVNWVLSNPPHGNRIGRDLNLKKFYGEYFEAIIQKLSPELTGLLISQKVDGEKLTPTGWRLTDLVKFNYNSNPVQFILCRKDKP